MNDDWKQKVTELEQEARQEAFWQRMDRLGTILLLLATGTIIGLCTRGLW